MSRVVSFRDLLLSEELSHIPNEIFLLHPDNDKLVRSVLTKIGFHEQHDVFYEPSKHRDLRGNVAIGFQAIGEHSRDRKFHSFLDAYDVCVVSGMQDATLGRELATLMGKTARYSRPVGEVKPPPNAKKQARYEPLEDDEDEYPESEEINENEYCEPDYLSNLAAIEQLETIRDQIRSDVNMNKGN